MSFQPRSSTVLHVALLALAIVAVLTGCGATPPAAAPESPSPDASSAPDERLTPYYAQRPAWKDCGKGFQCSTVQVPLDYAAPDGRRITIAVNRMPALPGGQRIGSLVLNPGGPGGSGLDAARATGPLMDRRLRKSFDVIGFDPRGVGESTPVRCLTAADHERQRNISFGDDEAGTKAAWRTLSGQCERNAGWLLPHVGTDNVARDMDVLRAVLGDRSLTYLGWSYGTELGSAYADLFPGKVRAAVLDSAVNPSADPLDLSVAQFKGFELALHSFIENCFTASDCPLRSRTVKQAAAEIAALAERADAEPLGGSVPGGQVLGGVAATLYSKSAWPMLRKALAQAMDKKQGTLLAELADSLEGRKPDGTWSNQMEAGLAVRCADWPRTTRVQASAAAEGALRDAPTFGKTIALTWTRCFSWPVPPPKAQRPAPHAKGSAPILIIGTLRDPATPYAWSVALTGHLENARLLTFEGDGHGVYLMAGSNCADDAIDDYLTDLRLPPEGMRCPGV
ncbi:alpha/beta hydrolase [Spongiactinospora sp. TRM90649]|uniref:alpha/beta hydrolase n=1 Tax=Spongiactinospora sp. TRM90649 TaxID=3031114 RepID=UPI0023F8998B|nr:alpha/beta hydrolase [Spongiactinospora sp. TRM90649]MDF5756529.1 alpha/beta hydrolase [Spongiactinospora sp. TRM90649]